VGAASTTFLAYIYNTIREALSLHITQYLPYYIALMSMGGFTGFGYAYKHPLDANSRFLCLMFIRFVSVGLILIEGPTSYLVSVGIVLAMCLLLLVNRFGCFTLSCKRANEPQPREEPLQEEPEDYSRPHAMEPDLPTEAELYRVRQPFVPKPIDFDRDAASSAQRFETGRPDDWRRGSKAPATPLRAREVPFAPQYSSPFPPLAPTVYPPSGGHDPASVPLPPLILPTPSPFGGEPSPEVLAAQAALITAAYHLQNLKAVDEDVLSRSLDHAEQSLSALNRGRKRPRARDPDPEMERPPKR